jgi:hypothetical protein
MKRLVKAFAAAVAVSLLSGSAFAGDPPEMRVAKPGSPEAKRLARLKAKAEAGLIPVHQIGGVPSPLAAPEPVPQGIGTRVAPHPDAKGEMLKFQQAFVAALAKQDPHPPGRADHFAWIPRYDHVRQLGWNGSVVGVQPQPDGSALVSVEISPYLASPYMKTLVMDYVTEVYRVAGGRLTLVSSDAAVPKPRLQNFPVH